MTDFQIKEEAVLVYLHLEIKEGNQTIETIWFILE